MLEYHVITRVFWGGGVGGGSIAWSASGGGLCLSHVTGLRGRGFWVTNLYLCQTDYESDDDPINLLSRSLETGSQQSVKVVIAIWRCMKSIRHCNNSFLCGGIYKEPGKDRQSPHTVINIHPSISCLFTSLSHQRIIRAILLDLQPKLRFPSKTHL